MKIGVRAHDFGRRDIDFLASVIKNAGFDCTQLAPAKAIRGIEKISDITPFHMNEIRKIFAKNSVEITVLGCYIEPSLPDREKRLANVELFRQNLSFAKSAGISIVGTETTHLDINTGEGERERIYELLKDSVLRMAEQAEKEGVYIGIEPVAENTLNTPELTRRLLDEVDSERLKIIFDPVNLVLPGTIEQQDDIFGKVFELLGEDIVAVHVKDIVIENDEKAWRNIGKGVINYPLIIDWLKENKPNMRLLREGVKMDSYEIDQRAMRAFI